MRKYLSSLWESLVDGIVDINAHRSRSLLQVIGIVLGVASVVATFGLIEGGKRQMNRVYDMTGGVRKMRIDNRQTTEASQGAAEKASKGLTYDDSLALRRDARLLEIVEPTMQREALLRAASGFEKTLEVSGATWGYEPMYNFHPAEGRFITDEDLATSAKVAVLGSTRREQFFGARPALGQTITIDGGSYTIVGVMERKEFYWNSANDNDLEWMNEFVFIPITTMLNRMQGDRTGQKIAFMNVQVRDLKDMDAAMDEVTRILRRTHGGVDDFEVFNRAAQMRRMEENGRIYDVTFLVCGTISLLVGGIVIMNILLASFNERVREVGTRKALGATGVNILAQFLVESVVVTIFGGLLGVALGSAFTRAISNLIQQPVVLTPQNAAVGLVFAVVIGVFFGFYPAIKAARLNPIQALRYE
ncbi:MAG TPA: ABC transporter permease [Vicinamibacteria bacterium]|nr:ABC transporter permease [Vicinamibacteria bacterium]